MTAPPNEHRPVIDKTDARGGVTGQNVRYVLMFGLAAAILALAAAAYFLV